MSDQNSQQEPSMEEILASIRRIISEDGDEDTAAAPDAKAAAPEPVAEAVPDVEEPGAVEPEPEEEEILELTDEVQDDGTVVNLNTGEPIAEEETPEAFVESLETEEEVELEMVDAEEEPAIEEVFSEPDPEPEPDPVPDPQPERLPVEAVAAEAADRLVSDNPAMTSVTSLSALAAAVDTHRRAVDPSIGPKTIEDLVKEVMRPMIKEWLDDNLPALVERMVGREIERLTREAEDISQR